MGVRKMGEAELRIQEIETHPKLSSARDENVFFVTLSGHVKGLGT